MGANRIFFFMKKKRNMSKFLFKTRLAVFFQPEFSLFAVNVRGETFGLLLYECTPLMQKRISQGLNKVALIPH